MIELALLEIAESDCKGASVWREAAGSHQRFSWSLLTVSQWWHVAQNDQFSHNTAYDRPYSRG